MPAVNENLTHKYFMPDCWLGGKKSHIFLELIA